jgi:oxygen-dependent protoporphyrinogen oxidase
VVVGAGIAGLTAAHFLTSAGIRVKVLEAAGRAGGRMTTDAVDGFLIDRGAQFLSSEYSLLLSLASELGMATSVRETSPASAIVRGGKSRHLRGGRPLDALTSGLLDARTWFRLGWRTWQLRQPLRTLPLNDYSRWSGFDNESVASWANRTIGRSATEFLFDPVLEGFYFQPPEGTSLPLALAVLAFGFRRSRTITLEGGIGTLPEAMARRLDVVLDSPVDSIETGASLVTVTAGNTRFAADYAILAVPAPQAQRLYSSPDEVASRLMATCYSACINIAAMTRPGFRLPAGLKTLYGVLIPRSERGSVAAIGIESNKSPRRVPHGQLLNIMLSGAASMEMMPLDDGRIVDATVREAEPLFPGLSAQIAGTRIFRWQHAEPCSPIGRARDLSEYRSAVRPPAARVLLAGDYMSMPFTEGAAESGRWAAQQIAASIRRADGTTDRSTAGPR